MKFKRLFVTEAGSPYKGLNFVERTSELRNSDGSTASSKMKVTVPEAWSQVATDIMAQKYIRKAGIPEIGGESDCRQVFHRLAGCWTEWGRSHKYFDTKEDAAAFYDETCHMLANQMCAPNSPQWFNTGLHYAYGIKGPSQGHYYVDPKTDEVVRAKSAYERPQPHACFIQSIGDDLVNEGGIMDLWVREARLFKYGSGTGTNFSSLRGEGEPLSGGGVSSGLMSFLKIGDRAAGAIKSGGTTRRAAKMVCLDMDHPDIEKFVNWKVVEEQKVAALVAGSKSLQEGLNQVIAACQKLPGGALSENELYDPHHNEVLKVALVEAKKLNVPMNYIQRALDLAKQGVTSMEIRTYDLDWNSEAYSSVSGQNSNNSVRITNDFMNAVERDGNWELKFRTNGKVVKELKARDLWEDVAHAAWACADPGVQFDTTINEWHTCPEDGRINASNPCSEYMFLDDTACNLASLNLIRFYDPEHGFDHEKFIHAVRIWTVILDISVQMAQFPSREIARKSWDFRTLGLGYANIGAMLMQMGLPYGDERAMAVCGAITSVMCAESYRTSAEMAGELGAFPRFEANRKHMLRVISNHRSAAQGTGNYDGLTIMPLSIDHSKLSKDLSEAAQNIWDEAYKLGQQNGYRNAQVTVLAPTGTIGLLMDCDTTGIEPDFALVKFKKLAGGGYFKIINQSIPVALKNLGYSAAEIEQMINYTLGRGTLHGSPHINHESLKEKGFSDKILSDLELSLSQSFDISFAFNRWSLGDDFCTNVLGIDKESLDSSQLNILKEIGFSGDQIQAANEFVCGTMTVEGAPHIKQEHLAVFDCANKCGAKGVRFISAEKHIDTMAAAQPFISGAISKTINLPYSASISAVQGAYVHSWKRMLKANAIYRDGSKLSQPLNTSAGDWSDIFVDDKPAAEKITKLVNKAVDQYVTKKRSLPHRRRGYTQKVRIGGHKVYVRTGEYEDGTIGEIFLDINKEGTLLRSMMNCFAVSVSLGLQYGVPLEDYVNLFTFTKFEPNGLVLGHENIKRSTSIIDFIFRDLAINYLDRHDLAHAGPAVGRAAAFSAAGLRDEETVEKVSVSDTVSMTVDSSGGVTYEGPRISLNTAKVSGFADSYAQSRMQGYDGDPCSECGALTLVRNGACLKCDSCGGTTGCS
jgi:ribonucleoside-diphosphate reductase alpha chain